MSLRFAALGLLAQHPGSGYDLLKRFEGSMANVWAATQSQLYGELGRLEEDRWIDIIDVGPRGRKVYAPTDTGRAALSDWLKSPLDGPTRNARLLQVFLLSEVDHQTAVGFFESVIAEADERLAHLEVILADVASCPPDDRSPANEFARIALEYGLRHYRSEGDWARWSLDRIS